MTGGSMLGLAARSEGLADEHAATPTGARLLQGARLIGFIRLGWRAALRLCSARRHGEQLAGAGNIVGATAAGKQTIMSDAMEPLGQHVHQETADELVRGQRHDLVPGWPVDAVILVSEGDAPVVAGDQPVVGDGDAVGVARQISATSSAGRGKTAGRYAGGWSG